MFKICKIAGRTFTHYRYVCIKTYQNCFINTLKLKPQCRVHSLVVNYKSNTVAVNKLRFSDNILMMLSILTWLGFTEEDEEKESELIMTLKRAVLCTQREQYDKAEQMLHLALRIAQQQQNEQGILYCYDLMANLAFDQLQLEKAEKLFVSVMQILLGNGTDQDDTKVIHISLKLARICQLKADMEKAEMGYQWCLEKIEKHIGSTNPDAKVLYGVINDWYAQFLLDKGDIQKSLLHLKEAYRICKETEVENKNTSVLLLNDLAITCFRAEDANTAELYLKEAIKIGGELEDKSRLGVLHANLGLILLHKGIAAEAKKSCEEAWHIGKQHENTETLEQANYCFDQIKISMVNNKEKSV